MDLAFLKKELVRDGFLNEVIYFEELDSTNNYAKINNLQNDTLVITSNQTNGTGRFNRHWKSEPFKDLTFTLVKNIDIPVDEIHKVNFYSSYILFDTLKKYFIKSGIGNVCLKWPNDILLSGKKVAGLLLDVKNLNSEIKKFIIGIGLNVNSENFSGLNRKATSLRIESKVNVNTEDLLVYFINNFYNNFFLINNNVLLMQSWISNTDIIGEKIFFRKTDDDTENEVKVLNIDSDGGLCVRYDSGKVKKFYSGEITLIKS